MLVGCEKRDTSTLSKTIQGYWEYDGVSGGYLFLNENQLLSGWLSRKAKKPKNYIIIDSSESENWITIGILVQGGEVGHTRTYEFTTVERNQVYESTRITSGQFAGNLTAPTKLRLTYVGSKLPKK